MRRYETILILDPDLSEEGRQPMLERIVEAIIPEQGGELIASDEWGNRKLAYEIKKQTRGYYVYLDYCGTGSVVDEIERFCRIEDGMLKYMTMVTDTDFDPETLKVAEETAEAEAAEDDDSATAEPQTPAEDIATPEPADGSETETEKENQ